VAGEVMFWATKALVVAVLALTVGWSVRQLVGIVLEAWRHRRIEREVWRRHQARINLDRLGVTPVDQIPAEWLRKPGGR
jgi:hypothetical protein